MTSTPLSTCAFDRGIRLFGSRHRIVHAGQSAVAALQHQALTGGVDARHRRCPRPDAAAARCSLRTGNIVSWSVPMLRTVVTPYEAYVFRSCLDARSRVELAVLDQIDRVADVGVQIDQSGNHIRAVEVRGGRLGRRLELGRRPTQEMRPCSTTMAACGTGARSPPSMSVKLRKTSASLGASGRFRNCAAPIPPDRCRLSANRPSTRPTSLTRVTTSLCGHLRESVWRARD